MGSTSRGGRTSSLRSIVALGRQLGQHRRTRLAGSSRSLLATGLALAVLGTFAASAGAQSDTTAVTFPGGPLTVYVGPRGECQSSYLVNGLVAGNFFYGGNQVGDCGFFLAFPTEPAGQPAALKKTTFGFEGAAGPSGLTEYVPVSQSPVTGSGTATDPYIQTTVFKVVDSVHKEDALITETTTYVNGEPQFTSTYNVKNMAGATIYFRAIYAGDLYVNGNDLGTGVFLAGPPRFIGGQNTGSGVIGGFQEAPAPALPWSSFQEAYWNTAFGGFSAGDNGIWHDVQETVEESHAFNETIEPMELDNGAGVEWDQLRTIGLSAGSERAFTIINRTQIPSGLQLSPANQTLTQGQTATVTVTSLDTAKQPYAGKSLHYTITGANPQSGAVTLNSSGQAQISYVGHNAGVDTDQLFVDLGGTGTKTSNDPSGTAVVTFVPPPPTPNSSYKVQSIHANSDGTITIVFVPSQSGQATLVVTVPTGTIARTDATAAKRAKKCKRGLVRIKGKCRPPTTVTGRTTAPGTAGVPLALTVKASGRVKALLKKGKTVHLTATLTYQSSLGGTPTVEVFHVTVKGKKAKKKGHKHH
jgi:hypothetical protein